MESPRGKVVHDEEKKGVEHIDRLDTDASPIELDDEEEFSPEEQKRIIRRIDRRLIATCGFMYCISLLDRTNLSAAIIAV